MIRSRFTWALVLVLCAGLVACGTNDEKDPSPGGAGGTGGVGGTGGTGGTGGGDPAECGNDIKEAGEECDDGNTEPGDGCDEDCRKETVEVGPCDGAIDYRAAAKLESVDDPLLPGKNRTLNGTITAGANAMLTSVCGGDGQETVFRFITDGKGVLLWRLHTKDREGLAKGLATYAMTSCSADPAPACTVDGDVGRIVVEEAGDVIIVVDSVETVEETVGFNLVTSWLPLREAGESCDVTRQNDACRSGHVCKGEPAVCQEGSLPVITRAVAYISADYADLSYVLAEGTDADDDIVGYNLEPLDENGEPMVIFDSDGDGTKDSSRVYIRDGHVRISSYDTLGLFASDGSWLAKIPTFSRRYGFAFIYPNQPFVAVRLTMVDDTGLESAPVVAEAPVFAGLGDSCDTVGFVPCGSGLICRDVPAACRVGTAPAIDRAVYGPLPDGKLTLVVSGEDIDDDLVAIRFEMIDANGEVIIVDYDGDGTVDDSSTNLEMATNGDTTFLGSPTISAAWDAPQIALTPIDSLGLEGERRIFDRTPIPVIAVGDECSLDGWNVCESGLHCVGDTPRCTHPRDLVCEAAPEIDVTELEPGVDIARDATGTLTAPGFWDPPEGCGSKTGMPDGIVVLRLPEGVTGLTLSTNNDETKDGVPSGDTILYLLPTSCGSGEALGCNDDADPGHGVLGSTLELEDVPAGEYTVVVDSVDSTAAGGTFKLDVTVTIGE